MKFTRLRSAQHALILLPLLLTFGVKSAIAQINPATDGTGTIVQTQNNQINISGGTQAGSNQFHSFQQFGVNAGQTANFLSNPGIMNILGRVTGGDASLINGMLKVSGSNANLYLINPAGIVFGKDASLNIPAAFTATTANGIGFGNGNWFNAIGSNNYATLTANPTSFGFIGTSGSLVNSGNLAVNPGQSIALVGGTVVNTGTIAAPGGNITIAAIPGSKMVRIGQAGTVLSLDLPTSDQALINAPIATPLSLPALLTGGSIPSAMGVVVEDGVIKLTSGSASVNGTLNADGTGSQSGGNVIAYADNHLDFGGSISAKGGELGGNGGFVDTSGKGSIAIAPSAQVLTTAAKGLTGTWLIDPADLEVVAGTGGAIGGAGSTIGASTIVTALNSTNVNLQADNSITVNAAIDSRANANAGDLKLTAPTANLNQAITLKPGSTLSGTATTVNVGATGTVQNGIDVSAAGGTVNLAAATYTLAQEVGIKKNVIVRGTGAGSTTVSGNNVTRVFNVGLGSTVTLDGMSIVNGISVVGGGIYNEGTLTVSNSTLSGNSAIFNGGGILNNGITTIQNSILENNAANGSTSDGGGIYNRNQLTIDQTTLRNNTSGDDGGAIRNDSLLTITNSTLSGNTAQSSNSGTSGGGAILNTIPATATITNSTLSGNSAKVGGAIRNDGTLTLTNNTVSTNTATVVGGGVANTVNPANPTQFGKTTLKNTIIAGNIDTSNQAPDAIAFVQNSFTDQGNNLIGIGDTFNGAFNATTLKGSAATPLNSLLAPLGNYGGPTQTHALLPSSAAINAGNTTSPTTDQRGQARVGIADIGAFESQGFTVVATAGTPQSKTVDTAFTTPLTVKVTANNPIEPVAGGIVTFTAPVSTSTATLSTPKATIDASGTASTIATANTKIGSYTVKAGIAGIATTADFTLTNLADVANAIATTSGSGQSAVVDNNFTNNLVATVTDKFGNPVANSTVTFTVPGSGASGIFTNNTVTTNANGVATIAIKANTKSGTFTAKGGVSGITGTADFALTNISDVANAIATTSGSGQSAVVDNNFTNNLVATVTDKFGNPVANSTVTFTVPGSGASGVFTNNAVITDADGKATIAIKANTKSGTFTAQGGVAGVTGKADFALTNLADVANAIATTSGSGQSAVVDNNFTNNLVATVTDKFGNPVANSTVTFTVPGSGASGVFTNNTVTTNENGIATIAIKANTKAGTFTTTGTVEGVTTGADFSLTNQADVASQVTTTSGSGQITTVNTNFTDNLVATVTDKFGNPIAGTTVTFSTPGSGASATFASNTATTGADGKASIVAPKANTQAGIYSATGSVSGMTQGAEFTLTNQADKPSQINIQNTTQNAIVNQTSNNALQVKVLDQYGNPVVNHPVTLTLPSSGASGVFAGGVNSIVLTTDANGFVTTPLTANSTPGTYTGTIQVQGNPQITSFTFTNDPAPVRPKSNPNSEIEERSKQKLTDHLPNQEVKEKSKQNPTIVTSESILCIERSSGGSSTDSSKDVPSCGGGLGNVPSNGNGQNNFPSQNNGNGQNNGGDSSNPTRPSNGGDSSKSDKSNPPQKPSNGGDSAKPNMSNLPQKQSKQRQNKRP